MSEELIARMRSDMQQAMSKFEGKRLEPQTLAALKGTIAECLTKYVNNGDLIPSALHIVVLRADDDRNLVMIVLVDPDHPPRFVHDCSDCQYLGASDHFDHYFCAKAFPPGAIPLLPGSCISRYGDAGSDYNSAPSIVADQSSLGVRVSFDVAKKLGLLQRGA